jgi:hypothetical protein
VENYCVQFYVNKAGDIALIGTTVQLVTPEGNYLGGLIHYRETDMSKFFDMIAAVGGYAHQQGYFGVIGLMCWKIKTDSFMHRCQFSGEWLNSTCLQRHTLLGLGKEVAKYSSDYRMDGTLDTILNTLKPELERKDFIILSALEKVNTEKYILKFTEL